MKEEQEEDIIIPDIQDADGNVVRFGVDEKYIKEIVALYGELTASVDDPDSVKKLHKGYWTLRKTELRTDERRLLLNAEAQKLIKKNNGDHKKLMALINPTTVALKERLDAIKEELDRRERERLQVIADRVNARKAILREYGCTFDDGAIYFMDGIIGVVEDLHDVDGQEYNILLENIKPIWEMRQQQNKAFEEFHAKHPGPSVSPLEETKILVKFETGDTEKAKTAIVEAGKLLRSSQELLTDKSVLQPVIDVLLEHYKKL